MNSRSRPKPAKRRPQPAPRHPGARPPAVRPAATPQAQLVARLRLDHRRIRALLQLLLERPDSGMPEDALLEWTAIARDVMHYLHDHVDPAHHALEDRLLGAVRGVDPAFDIRAEELAEQHDEARAESGAILAGFDPALEHADASCHAALLDALSAHAGRALGHLAREEDGVFDRLQTLLAGLDAAALPAPGSDPLFDEPANPRYASLQRHYLHRVRTVRNHGSVLDAVPLDALIEAFGLLTEQLSVYAGMLRRQRTERLAARKRHARKLQRTASWLKPVVVATAIGVESLRALKHQRQILHELLASPHGTLASARGFLRYAGRRWLRPRPRRRAAVN